MSKNAYYAPITDDILSIFLGFSTDDNFLGQHYATLRGSRIQQAYTNLFSALGIIVIGSLVIAFTTLNSPVILYGPLAGGLIYFLYSLYAILKAIQFKNMKHNISADLEKMCHNFYLNAVANGKGSRLEGKEGDARTEMLWEVCDVVPYFLYQNPAIEIPNAASKWLQIRNQSIEAVASTSNPFERNKVLNRSFPITDYCETMRDNPDIADISISVSFWDQYIVAFHNVAVRINGNWFLLSLEPGEAVKS
ncbi:MAG: hypothetical protein AAGD25_30710 [Cyanobacteria bacterium P01_F01_bin.150]